MIFILEDKIFQAKFGLNSLILLRENLNKIVEDNLQFRVYCSLITLQPDITFKQVSQIIEKYDLSDFSLPQRLPSLTEVEGLYTKIVGEAGIAPSDFWNMTIEEADRAYEGYLQRKELEANLIKLAIAESNEGNTELIRLTEDKGYVIGNLDEREQTFRNLKIGEELRENES